ncbi:MAG: alpha/beta hydrolase [Bacteroidota bacterium]
MILMHRYGTIIFICCTLLLLASCTSESTSEKQQEQNMAGTGEEENLSTQNTSSEKINYGNNAEVGDYFEVDGVKLYYEVYGQGGPILMLHGGIYGYIDEFSSLIDKLSKNYQVICLATRGHGKSEVGNTPYTYQQRADDAYQLLQHLKLSKVLVIGFSDGGHSALKLAALYPETVRKVIAMGVGDNPKVKNREPYNYTSESLLAESGSFFQSRLALMPEPDRWEESLQYSNHLYNEDFLSTETYEKIQCPVLLMNGENDEYSSVNALVKAHKAIPNAHLSIIPKCGHVIFFCNFEAVWESMDWFL